MAGSHFRRGCCADPTLGRGPGTRAARRAGGVGCRQGLNRAIRNPGRTCTQPPENKGGCAPLAEDG